MIIAPIVGRNFSDGSLLDLRFSGPPNEMMSVHICDQRDTHVNDRTPILGVPTGIKTAKLPNGEIRFSAEVKVGDSLRVYYFIYQKSSSNKDDDLIFVITHHYGPSDEASQLIHHRTPLRVID